MDRTWGAAVVAAGLAGVVGCASTARPMFFHRNQIEQAACPPDHGVPITEGPILADGGFPVATVPTTAAPIASVPPVVAPPPGGTFIAPPATPPVPPVSTPPPPVGPQPRTAPTSGTNPTNATR
jgi:hypothetical protein